MLKSRVANTGRILLGLGIVVLLVVGCNSKKGSSTGPNTQPSLVMEWPAEASGVYRVQIDAWSCGLLRCVWDSVATFVDTTCAFPFQYQSDTANGLTVISVEGIVSDTLVNVTVMATLRTNDGRLCDLTISVSTVETGLPPSRDSWQIIVEPTFSGCEGLFGTKVRYTYMRTGEFKCFTQPNAASSRSIPLPLRLMLQQVGSKD